MITDVLNEEFVAKLAVVGVGGQGCNLVNRLYTQGIKSARTMLINTDAKHLSIVNADKKILIGKNITHGLGAGGFPEVAEKCADASRGELSSMLDGYDMVFIAAGMGGGTGGGAAPVVADIAKEQGALVVSFVTYPFAIERSRKSKADWSLQQLSRSSDTTIVIENDRLMSYAPNLPMERAFELIDNIAVNAVKGIADTIMLPSLINLDFADVRAVMKDAGTAVINLGAGSGHDKIEKSIKTTLQHPLMNVDLSGAKSAMVHVSGGSALTIEEATRVGEGVTEGLDAKANVIFGARMIPELSDQIRVMSIITGVTPRLGQGMRAQSERISDLSIESIY
jgi:cell division protein FtsZ